MKDKSKLEEGFSHWNYRIVKKEYVYSDGLREYMYGLYEVYYKDKKPVSCTKYPTRVVSENIKGLRWILKKYRLALRKPVLNYEKIGSDV